MLQKCGLETASTFLKASPLKVKFEMINYFELLFIYVVF